MHALLLCHSLFIQCWEHGNEHPPCLPAASIARNMYLGEIIRWNTSRKWFTSSKGAGTGAPRPWVVVVLGSRRLQDYFYVFFLCLVIKTHPSVFSQQPIHIHPCKLRVVLRSFCAASYMRRLGHILQCSEFYNKHSQPYTPERVSSVIQAGSDWTPKIVSPGIPHAVFSS